LLEGCSRNYSLSPTSTPDANQSQSQEVLPIGNPIEKIVTGFAPALDFGLLEGERQAETAG
jgi:hypothetical protein